MAAAADICAEKASWKRNCAEGAPVTIHVVSAETRNTFGGVHAEGARGNLRAGRAEAVGREVPFLADAAVGFVSTRQATEQIGPAAFALAASQKETLDAVETGRIRGAQLTSAQETLTEETGLTSGIEEVASFAGAADVVGAALTLRTADRT